MVDRKRLWLVVVSHLLACGEPGDRVGGDAAYPTPDAGIVPVEDGGRPPVVDGEVTPPVDGAIVVPLEVFADHEVAVTIPLTDASGVDALYLRTHRLAYRSASTTPSQVSKGSVRLNDGVWIRLDPDNIECFAHEEAYGCLTGGYHTLRLTVGVDRLGSPVTGDNTLTFRFEGTDGYSMGYRIVDLDFLRDGDRILPPGRVVDDDPNSWPVPRPDETAEGQRLFGARVLTESPLSDAPLRASCADCHAHDGRDLAYFNYSNESIVQRSMFHGMSRDDGERIASYIRSLDLQLPVGLTVADLGRPWNPPYQPGPGLDAQPVERWAAGAGLDAVLERDADIWDHLFPEGDDPAAMRMALGPESNINHRELPLSIQLPDWNEWLPEVHPLDMFGEDFEAEQFDIGSVAPYASYQEARFLFAEGLLREGFEELDFFAGRVHVRAGGSLKGGRLAVTLDGASVVDVSGEWIVVTTGDNVTIRTRREDANRGIRHWAAVKQWEIVQEFQLEGTASMVVGGESRHWGTQNRNVFELAPHRAAYEGAAFAHHTDLVGKYLSTAWYQLQVVINSGHGFGRARLGPVDWNYQPAHVADIGTKVDGPRHPVRMAATLGEMVQFYSNRPPSSDAWGFQQMHPVRFAPTVSMGRIFDALDEGRRARLFEAMLGAVLDLYDRTAPEDWDRNGDNDPEPPSYRPRQVTGNLLAAHHGSRFADTWFSMIPLFRDAGVSSATIQRLIDFGEDMWPAGDWQSLRG